MSGAIAGTVIAGVSAAAAIGSTVMGAVQGNAQIQQQKKALAAQKTAQGQAEAQALSTQRKAEVAQNAANQKTPDISAILARAAGASKTGLGSTMLTGAKGIDTSSLNLGKTSLLGQ